jgi:hypothetical protein
MLPNNHAHSPRNELAERNHHKTQGKYDAALRVIGENEISPPDRQSDGQNANPANAFVQIIRLSSII